MKIYHWFIPNKKNKFHPFALRTTGLIVFLAIFLAIPLIYNFVVANQFKVLGYATNVSVTDLHNLSNKERISRGVSPLNLDDSLNKAALAKAKDMMADNYWAHVAPDGTTPWVFIAESGYQYSSAGENLAKDFSTSGGVVAGWMTSKLHKENVLNSTYGDVGYAVLNGKLEGSETTLVVAMYGLKSSTAIAATTPVENTDALQNGNIPIASGNVAGTTVSLPMKAYNSLNWGQKASVLLICTLMLLFIMKHTLIWREQKRGLKHIWLRAHPLGQALVLSVVMIFTIASGVGIVL